MRDEDRSAEAVRVFLSQFRGPVGNVTIYERLEALFFTKKASALSGLRCLRVLMTLQDTFALKSGFNFAFRIRCFG